MKCLLIPHKWKPYCEELGNGAAKDWEPGHQRKAGGDRTGPAELQGHHQCHWTALGHSGGHRKVYWWGLHRQSRELGVTKSLFHANLEERCRSLGDCTSALPSVMTCLNMLPTSGQALGGTEGGWQLLEASVGQSGPGAARSIHRKAGAGPAGLLAEHALISAVGW